MSDRELIVLMGGARLGELRQDRNGAVELVYDDDYRSGPEATPLSTSMPLTGRSYRGRGMRAFLWGLLPDNGEVLERWGREFRVAANNPFALLAHVGEDCAGGVQFVRPDQLDGLDPGGIDWLDDAALEGWARGLRLDPTAWLSGFEHGQFSLAGAQSKFALLHQDGRWGRPYGAVPTTHIVKLASGRWAEQELDEHLCLGAARLLGLPVARSEITSFGEERVIVIERYDRVRQGGRWLRVHQEDCCQALGVDPRRKYQSDGGPSAADIGELLRTVIPAAEAETTVLRLVDALAFNWLVGGTDAHAENYSLLMSGREVRLAPLYDLTSAFPYVADRPGRRGPNELDGSALQLAMSIGDKSLLSEIDRPAWARLAEKLKVDADAVVARVASLADRVADAFDEVATQDEVKEGGSTLPSLLVKRVRRHAARCQLALNVPRPRRRR